MRRPALLLLLGASTCACGSGGPSSTPRSEGIVPWVDRPVPPYVAPIPTPKPYPTSAPACHASQLRVSRGRVGVGLGNELEELVFHNRGRACLLRGYPSVSGLTKRGARRTLRPSRSGGGTYFGRLVPADMPPGGRTLLDFATSSSCEGGTLPGTTYRDLVFRLPQGGNVRAGKDVTITQVCGLSMSTFGVRPRPPTPAPETAGTLTATLAAPAAVRAGDTLDYVITLTNSTDVAVSLSPCPGYTQGIYASGLVRHGSFALNCDTVHTIPPHEHVRYAMRLRVPNRPARVAKLGWSLNDPYGPFVGTALQVTT